MSAVFRLGHQYNGAPCEVDNCPHSVENSSLKRCYEHNPQRLIEALFTPSERCKFGGVTCEGQASRATEDEVVMCETCYNVFQRIQWGHPQYRTVEQSNDMRDLMQRSMEIGREVMERERRGIE